MYVRNEEIKVDREVCCAFLAQCANRRCGFGLSCMWRASHFLHYVHKNDNTIGCEIQEDKCRISEYANRTVTVHR